MNLRAALAEFIGTFAFFFIGAGAIVTDHLSGGALGLVGIALAHGLVLSIMISAFGATSGGHFNPAVTFGFLVTRRIDIKTAVTYWVAQLVSGVLAGLALLAIYPKDVWEPVHLGTPVLGPDVSLLTGIFVEALITFFLVTAVFGTAVDSRAPKIGGFGIGLTLGVAILMSGPLTGGAANPARVFGPAVASGTWDNHLVYWIGPMLGGALAALVYHHLILKPTEEEDE